MCMSVSDILTNLTNYKSLMNIILETMGIMKKKAFISTK